MQDKVFDLYRNHFLPAYSDFVVLSQTKPQQILIEESNTLSHISQAFNEELDSEKQAENFLKAYNHIVRATLDLHKLIFSVLKGYLDNFVHNEHLRLSFNKAETEVLKEYSEFIRKGRDARKTEVNNIGNNPLTVISNYEQANEIGFKLYSSLDSFKSNKVNGFLKRYARKEILVAFFIGIISSFVAGNIPTAWQYLINIHPHTAVSTQDKTSPLNDKQASGKPQKREQEIEKKNTTR